MKKIFLIASLLINAYLIFFIAKRYYYHKVPPILWTYDIAMLGDSHIYRANWNKLLGKRVANFGKGSSTVQDMYTRLPGVINCKPKVCYLEGGINDIMQGIPQDTTLRYYRLIVDRLKEKGIQPVIMKVMKVYGDARVNLQVEQLNYRLNKLATFITADIIPDDLQQDGIHLNGSGYQKWAMAIR